MPKVVRKLIESHVQEINDVRDIEHLDKEIRANKIAAGEPSHVGSRQGPTFSCLWVVFRDFRQIGNRTKQFSQARH